MHNSELETHERAILSSGCSRNRGTRAARARAGASWSSKRRRRAVCADRRAAGGTVDRAAHGFDPVLALCSSRCYALVAGWIRFPIGAGYVVPSYVVLVPMLLLLPPATVPLLAAAGMAVAGARNARDPASVGRARAVLDPERLVCARVRRSCCWLAGEPITAMRRPLLIYAARSSPVASSTWSPRRCARRPPSAVAPRLQLRVVALVWLIDACTAPIGLLVAYAAHRHHAALLMRAADRRVLLLISIASAAPASRRPSTDSSSSGASARDCRRRCDGSARRLPPSSTSPALTTIVLRGSIEALDADAGRADARRPAHGRRRETTRRRASSAPLLEGPRTALADSSSRRSSSAMASGRWHCRSGPRSSGRAAAARSRSPATIAQFRADEQALMLELVERAPRGGESKSSPTRRFASRR